MSSRAFRVHVLIYQVVGWVCALLAAGASLAAYLAGQYGPSAVFIAFVALGVFVIVCAGSILLSEDSVTHDSLFGRYRIEWNQIRSIEVGPYGTLVLHGDGKRLVLTPPAYWSGHDKREAREFLAQKIRVISPPITASRTADYKLHKNVRIKRAAAS
jgi:hypothetical protein